MALSVHTGAITNKGSTGSQAYTGLGFQPKVVLFFSRINTTVNTPTTHHAYNFGVGISSSEQACYSFISYPGFNKAEVAQRIHDDAVITSTWHNSSALTVVSLTSMDVDGFTLNWDSYNSSLPQNGFYIALGGDDLTDVSLDFFTAPTSTGNAGFTGVGFQPTAVLLGMTSLTGTPPTGELLNTAVALGMATATDEVCLATANFEKNTPNCNSRAYDGRIVSIVQPDGTEGSQATLNSFDSDGFTLNFSDVTTGAFKFFALSMRGPLFKIGSDTQKTSTGTKATTGVGFAPKALLLAGINKTASTSIQSDAQAVFGSGSVSLWTRTRDGVSDGDPDGVVSNDSVFEAPPSSGTTPAALAILDSVDSDGFTLDWTTADATARAFYYLAVGDAGDPLSTTAESIIAVTDESRGLGTYRAESSVMLTDSATGVADSPVVEADASSTLTFTTEAVGFLETQRVGSTLVMTSVASATTFGPRSVESTLAVSQSVTVVGPISADAQSEIEVVQSAHYPIEYELDSSDSLEVEQTAVSSGPRQGVAADTLTLDDAADTQTKVRSVTQSVTADHEAVAVVSKQAVSILTVSQEVDLSIQVTSSSQLVNLQDLAEIPFSGGSQITLSQLAEVIRPNATNFVGSQITLAQAAVATGSYTVSGLSTLSITQAVSYETDNARRLCHYMPFVGSGSMPSAIPTADDGTFTKGIKLTHGVDTFTTTRSMNYGDVDRLVFDRINRVSRGGTLLVYADPIWPKLETLVFSVSGVKEDDARAYLAFLEPRVGQQMTLTTHEGRQWTGVVMNPDSAVIQDGINSYTLSIEFQGTEV